MAKVLRKNDEEFIYELLMAESSDEDDFVNNDSDDGEDDNVEVEDHVSDTEDVTGNQIVETTDVSVQSESGSEDDDDIPLSDLYMVRGKNKNILKWKKNPLRQPRNIRTRAENIVVRLPGPIGDAKNKTREIDCFRLFMDDTVINIIVTSTNNYIDHVKERFERERDAKNTDQNEIKAFLGILLLSGTLESNRKKTKQIWDNSFGSGVESCYLTMSEKRFHFLMRCIRFDDIRDRLQRKEIDRLASIRELFELLVQKFQSFFTPSEYCTVDEQLVALRGKCPFRMYMPKKPARYSIKIYALVCAKTMYTVNL